MSIINRLGTFFIWIGAGGIMVFILSDLAHTPVPALLFGGLTSVLLGVYLWWRNPRQPSQPSNRFRILKKSAKTKGQDLAQGSRRRQDRAHEAEPPTPTRQE